jgi:hypothetical protein
MDPKTSTQAARMEEGRAIAQITRQHAMHQRKLHKLNDGVIAKTREIMALEERYNVKVLTRDVYPIMATDSRG